MSGYKTFAIWGAGNLGARIATCLLARNVSVIILTRPSSRDSQANTDLAVKGATGITKSIEQLSGEKLEIIHVSRVTLDRRVTQGDAAASLLLGWDKGLGSLPNPLSHDMYPRFNPKTALQVLGTLVQ